MSYPALLDLRHCRVLIVGGGAVAYRKGIGVIEGAGRPTVIAPDIVPEFHALLLQEGLTYHPRSYRTGDTEGFGIVFAATGDPEVNAAIARESISRNAWVNVADDPDLSSFHVPAALRQADVLVALSTGGSSPLLSRRLRERLEEVVTPGVGRAAARLGDLRRVVRGRWPGDASRRRDFWSRLVTPEFLTCAIEGRDEEVDKRIRQCLSQS